ncbi:MAG: hypothetical protein M3Q44_06490 [bacterium]|nr:hypothetical protein [bacterium]
MSGQSHYHKLLSKWTSRHDEVKKKVWEKHLQPIAAGSMSAVMLFTGISSSLALPAPQPLVSQIQSTRQLDKKSALVLDLALEVPKEVRALNSAEGQTITRTLTDYFGITVSAELQEIRMNRNYGLIGAEQHLPRFPGDSVTKQLKSNDDKAMFARSGMTPGVGAWRYFVNSEKELTQKVIEQEKWYIAAPTFAAPGFNENVKEYKDFFKYRKVLVVNAKTGAAVVTDIADAGPGQSTGKHLGGSPEVMHYLGLGEGPRKGAVVYFFIDDPNDTIPLGPLEPK